VLLHPAKPPELRLMLIILDGDEDDQLRQLVTVSKQQISGHNQNGK